MLRQYENPYHARNLYIELQPEDGEQLRQLVQSTDRPLQAMIESTDTAMAAMLSENGFVCRRRCYDVEVSAAAYIGEVAYGPLLCAGRGEKAYHACAARMYQRYCETHEAINPWTAEFSAFEALLPELVWYDREGNLAFVENEEIAYVCGAAQFERFAACLLTKLFAEYAVISFEADDCDEFAMRLRAMFDDHGEDSFDTYIFEVK